LSLPSLEQALPKDTVMQRQLLLFLAVALGTVAATTGTARATGGVNPLIYGQTYSLQNLWNGNGGYLDTDGSGCQGNKLCVSTSITPMRDGGSGSWVILSAQGKAPGSTVISGDYIYLQNLWSGNGGFLDTDGSGCKGDKLCVSTANTPTRDGRSGNWRIILSDFTTGPIFPDQDVHLQNTWGSTLNGGYLDTDGNGCQGNMLCVATAPNWDRDRNSTHWSLRGSTTFAGASNTAGNQGWCLTTDQQTMLLNNGVSSLRWTNTGNLVLTNDKAVGPTADGNVAQATQQVWGLNSPTVLTGASAAKLCFSTSGVLSIADHAGNVAWQSSPPATTSLTNYTVLTLSDCTLMISGLDGTGHALTPWTAATQACEARQRANNLPMTTVLDSNLRKNQCWPASSNKVRLLWDTETNTETDWQNGHLFVFNTLEDPTLRVWDSTLDSGGFYNPSNAAMLCAQVDGNMVIYDASSHPLWSSNTVTSPGTFLTMDACGVNFIDSNTQLALHRGDQFYPDIWGAPYRQDCHKPRMSPGQCFAASANATLVKGADGTHLDWSSAALLTGSGSGASLVLIKPNLDINNPRNSVIWQSPFADHVCFQNDGNFVLYDSSGGAVWASNTTNASGGPGHITPNALSLDGENLSIVDQSRAAFCNPLNECLRQNNQSLAACPGYTTTDQNTCATTAYWTLWQPGAQAGLVGFAQGGFSFIKDAKAGNSQFGVDSWIFAGSANHATFNTLKTTNSSNSHAESAVTAIIPASPPSDYTMVMSDVGVSTTLFGATVTIIEANGFGYGANGVLGGGLDMTVLGLNLQPWTIDTSGINVAVGYEQVFLAETEIVDVGIPITLSGKVAGSVGINFTGAISLYPDPKLMIESAPFASLDAIVSIAVGVPGVEAGIQGDLTIIQLSVPFDTTFTFKSGGTSTYEESASVQVTQMSGALSLYASAGPFSASKQLCGWNGTTSTQSLFDMTGNL
jgi:hypothetical protein